MPRLKEKPRLTEEGLKNFKGSVVPCLIEGPDSLYRFSHHPQGFGEWWVPQRTFMLIYNEARDLSQASTSNTVGSAFRRLYRQHLAISLDWNDLENLFRLDIPEGKYASGWRGITAQQPLVSVREQERLGRSIEGGLKGGMEQLFLEVYDLTWARRVSL